MNCNFDIFRSTLLFDRSLRGNYMKFLATDLAFWQTSLINVKKRGKKNCRRANDERINKLNATGCLSHWRNYARRMGSLKELTIYLCLLLRYVSYWCLENRCYYKRVKSSITCTWRFQWPLSFFSKYMCSSCKLVVRNRKCSGLQEHFVENSERDQTQCQLVKQPQLNGN